MGCSKGKIPPMSLVHPLVNGIAEMAGISPKYVFSDDRRRAVSWVRAMVCRWLRAHDAGYSTTGIGLQLGLDHTSVLHLTKRAWPLVAPPLKARWVKKPPAEIIYLGENPKLALKTGNRIMELMGRCAVREFSSHELAAILHVSPGAATSALHVLLKRKRVIRVRTGTYRPIKHESPPASPALAPSAAFIRPISKERMMAGR